MSKIKVSILVPICNVEKYLKQCLNSLVSQTLKDIEIICINDGSKDKSLEIIKDYLKNDRRIVLIDKVNTGYGDSMNCGLFKARGEYIGIVESDDFADINMFQRLYEIAKMYSADVVKTNYFLYWDNPQKKQLYNNLQITTIIHDSTICKEKILMSSSSIWSAIYKRDFIISNDVCFLTTPGASYQDTSFKFKTTLLAKKIVLLPEAYLYYRQDNANSSVKAGTYEKAILLHKEYEEMYNFITKYKFTSHLVLFYTEVLNGCFWNYLRIDNIYKAMYFQSMRSFINHFDGFCIDHRYTSKILRLGGLNAIKNNNRLLLDVFIKINRTIKEFTKLIR